MLIEAETRDLAGVLEIFPGRPAGEAMSQVQSLRTLVQLGGTEISGQDGTTVRYEGMIESRAVDIPTVLQFLMDTGSGVSATVIVGISAWIIGRFRGRTDKVRVNSREIDLDDEGNVRRIVEEEITRG